MNFYTLMRFAGVTALFLLTHLSFAQVTIYDEPLRDGSLPVGWSEVNVTFATSAGGYANFTSSSALLTTPVFDASSYNQIDVSFSVAKFGSGGNGPLTLEYSLDGGTSWIFAANSSTPTSSTYIDDIITISSVSATMVIRFTRENSSSQKRLRDVVIEGLNVSVNTLLEFTSPTYTIAEDGSFIDICASISNEDASTATTIEVALTGGTATNGSDYDDGAGTPAAISFPVTLTFPAGSSANECFTIYISTDDSEIEGDETIELALQNVMGGNNATIGGQSTTIVTITDNDAPATCFTDNGDFEIVPVTLNRDGDNWQYSGGGSYTANGYCNCSDASDLWLIYGELDASTLVGTDVLELILDASENHSGPGLEIFYSTSYTGCPDDAGNNWVSVGTITSAGSDLTFDLIGAAGNSSVYIGIQYLTSGGNGGSAREWTISNIEIVSSNCPTANTPVVSSCVIPVPDNDECTTATSVSCGTTLVAESTVGATDNGDVTGCDLGKGIWYEFVGTNQEVTVSADGSNDDFDLELSVSMSSDCSSFINIDCKDTELGDAPETVTFFANEGVTYYFYVAFWSDESTTVGEFDLSVTCTDPIVSEESFGGCYAANAVSATGSATWLNIFDSGGDLVASVFDSEALGTITTDVYLNNGPVRMDGTGVHYLDRNVAISVQNEPMNGTVQVRFYLTGGELSSLISADADVSSIGDLNATKETGGCQGEFSGGGEVVFPADAGALGSNYYIELEVSSFSNFFFHAGTNALPVELTNLNAKQVNSTTHLTFTTTSELNNSHFNIERSTDGRSYQTIGRVEGKGTTEAQIDYEFIDEKPQAGWNYYRLKQVDYDGASEYFGPVSVFFGAEEEKEIVKIYPTAVADQFTLEVSASVEAPLHCTIINTNAQVLRQWEVQEKALSSTIAVSELPAGTYWLRWQLGSEQGVTRFVKL